MSRRESREEAFKALYAREAEGFYRPDNETNFTRELVNGVIDHQEQLDDQLSEHLTDWRMDRVYPIERILLRLGLYEILHMETNKAVVINEAVELAKQYGDDGTGAFVNGILDNFEKPQFNGAPDS